jgi:hypothetical protein
MPALEALARGVPGLATRSISGNLNESLSAIATALIARVISLSNYLQAAMKWKRVISVLSSGARCAAA